MNTLALNKKPDDFGYEFEVSDEDIDEFEEFFNGEAMMKVDITSPNPALESIFSNPNQIITLDANFLIPPDRSKYAKSL